jgi:hypothetical protein
MPLLFGQWVKDKIEVAFVRFVEQEMDHHSAYPHDHLIVLAVLLIALSVRLVIQTILQILKTIL